MNIKKIKLDNDVAHRNISRYHVIMRFTSQFKFMEKMYPKNGLNNDFLKPKMVLDVVFDGFSCILVVCII